MSPILNVGVVGTGIFAKDRHLPSFQEMPEEFKVVAAFNRTKAKALTFGKLADIPESKVYDTIDDLMRDPEVTFVDSLVPVQNNVTNVKKAIEHKKPILLEKPIAATMQQARELVNLSESTDLPIGIAENWLYLNCIDVAKEHLKSIGPIVAFTHNSTGPFFSSNKYLVTSWRQNPEHIGGFLSDGGVHQLALVTAILGEIDSVSALTTQVREASGTDDVVFSTVKMDSGVIGTFSYGSAFGSTDKSVFLKIYGKNGNILIDLCSKKELIVKVTVGSGGEVSPIITTINLPQDDSFGVNDEFLNFRQSVIKKDKKLFKGQPKAAFHHLACVDAFLKSSAKNGTNVKVEKY
ncbi:hypothetical protein TBLA_0I00110 [Henningerozyma blattae CBS 6284]|uniref:Gfo/Idh/MocA-like oxidoreductase N-terminal domain-containing protein n=1 Tax=Henningerozyma blattae (strain ATCC 34711 / CBS 6284 / DSM 70876 / NBRC 10599 / NRRL Y-10934 / UCD 77-7) TaxID=1071380 RepID=I2H8H4_HENB6|nr:hypothetical protein TBLA_0I00110 [Tetrapisispora blattae CBS 6284]CCH62676.1 hypothetical protein TBLA_0I00110 [Tetrapisispora blattae CBS 6284]